MSLKHVSAVRPLAPGHLPWRLPWRLAATVALTAVSACNCDGCLEPVGKLPAPKAVLASGGDESPPLEVLEVGIGAVAVGAPAPVQITLRNDGNADLVVSDVILTSHPTLCPAPSGEFAITDPTGTPRAFELGAAQERLLQLSFSPTSGTVSCTALEVHSNDIEHPTLIAVIRGQGDAPGLCTDRATIDFGEVLVGDSKDDVVTLTSCGTRPITVQTITPNEQFPDPFTQEAPAPPVALDVGDSLTVPVHFAPLVAGQWSVGTGTAGVLTFSTDAQGQVYQIFLVGTARRPPSCQLQVIPAAVQFGNLGAGRPPVTQPVIVRNIGELDCTFQDAVLRDTSLEFTSALVDLTPGQVLAPQASGTVNVTFAPTTSGPARSTFLDVTSNDPINPTIAVPVQGTPVEVTPCFLEAEPTAVNYGNQPMLHTVERTVRLRNVGTEDCVVTDVAITQGAPEFGIVEPLLTSLDDQICGSLPAALQTLCNNFFGSSLGAFIPAGEFSDFVVSFRGETGSPIGLDKIGNVHFVYHEQAGFGAGSSGNDQTIDIPELAKSFSPCLTVTPQDIDYGTVATGAFEDQSVTVSNCGAVELSIRGLNLRSGTHPDFHIQAGPSAQALIGPGLSAQVTVRAAPTATNIAAFGAAMFGTLEVLSDQSPVSVSLRANTPGACTVGLVCSPQQLAFGDVIIGDSTTRSIICNNPGTSTVNLAPTVNAPFSIESAPASIAPGGQGVIRVGFTASGVGVRTATVNLGTTTCPGTAGIVDVNGVGVDDVLPVCPQPTAFTPQTTWEWDGGSTSTSSRQTWSTSLVSRLEDTTGDGFVTRDDMPRVVFISFDQADAPDYLQTSGVSGSQEQVNDPVPGIMRAISGDTGAEVWTNAETEARLNSSVTPALVDLDGDGCVDIVGQKYLLLPGVEAIPNGPKVMGKFARGNLIAFDCRGRVKWVSDEWTRDPNAELEDAGGIAVGDVDGDGFAEVAVGDHLYDHNGHLLWKGGKGTGSTGHGPVSVLANVDDAPGLELVAGTTVYKADGTILWDRSAELGDAHPAVADLDGDGHNEVVVRNSRVYVLNGKTGATIAGPREPVTDMGMGGEDCDHSSTGQGNDDPCDIIPTNPAILDVNGDGFLDIAVSAQGVMNVYDRNLATLWKAAIFDGTGASGPVGFDFENDGSENIVYSDESTVHGWSPTGVEIYNASRSSVTMMEYAVVADIDNDGHANIVVGSNEPQFNLADGLDAFENTGVSWANARAIWNQHAYIEGLVSELGTPLFENGAQPVPGFRTTKAQCVP